MPTKPKPEIINAANRVLDPHAVMEAVINETPELARSLVDAGLATEVTTRQSSVMQKGAM
jgi:hypothetical protein